MIPTDDNITNKTLEFLQTLYGNLNEGYLSLWMPSPNNSGVTHWFAMDKLPDMATIAVKLAQSNTVYYGVAAIKNTRSGRVRNQDAYIIPGLWMDIDTKDDKHPNNPSDINILIDFINKFPLIPSILVNSGRGLHSYWQFKEPWIFDTQEEHDAAALLLARFQQTIKSRAPAEWKFDNTSDLARVLRLPGTLNYKTTPPAPVTIISQNDFRYNQDDFEQYLIDDIPSVSTTTTTHSGGFQRLPTDGPAQYMLNNCMFMQNWQLNYKTMSEPEWMAVITNVIRGINGEDIIIEAAKNWLGEKYNHDKTIAKIRHAIEDFVGPQSCDYIRQQLGFQGCPAGGCDIQAPCGWSLGKVPQARAITRAIAVPTPETVYKSEVLGALAVLEKDAPAEYDIFYQRLTGQVNKNTFRKELAKYKREQSGLTVIDGGANDSGALQEGQKLGDVTTCSILPESPIDLALPVNFEYGKTGICFATKNQQGDTIRHKATGVPVLITERVYNIDSGMEKIEIAFRYYNYWRRITQMRSTVFNSRQITKLTDYGLTTSSESAKYLVKYLEALETANQDRIPLRYSVSKIGWRENGEFILPNESQYKIDIDDEGDITEAFIKRGSLEEWLRVATEVRKFPMARIVLATSLTAPLLKVLKHRNFLLYFWGTSGGGKTASMFFALSAWGAPEKMMINFNATQSGLERRLSFTSDLPTGINERQAAGGGRDKQEYLERIVYMLEGGKGKVRATKTGAQKTASWRTVGMACGEEPLTKETSIQGVKTRVLEINTYPVIEENFAKQIYSLAAENCGYAGPAFISRLILEIKNDNWIRDAYIALQQILTADYPHHFSVHIDAVALVATTDYLLSMWLFGIPQAQAEQEAYDLANLFMKELPTRLQISDVERGWDFVQNWLAANNNLIEPEHNLSKTKIMSAIGFRKGNETCIYPDKLSKAMEEVGFSMDKLLREFANAEKIRVGKDGSQRDFRPRVRFNGRSPRVIAIPDDTNV